MKKICVLLLTLILTIPLFIFNGCMRELGITEKNIYIKNLSLTKTEDYDGDFTQFIANEKACAVVSICSYFQYKNNKGSYSTDYQYNSGIILNNDGYILTTSRAVKSIASNQADSLSNITANEFYVSLNSILDVKDDYYLAKLVHCDENIGLAILKFVDNFYFYTDAQNTKSSKGFQVKAEFFNATATLEIGDDCAFAGNMLDEGVGITKGVISDNELTVLPGVRLNDKTYNYIQSSAALNEEMYGGALYDENGYVIGIALTKIISDTDYSVFNKISLALPSACIVEYIDAVSQEKQTVIEYTVVS